ncbi:MAG: CsbD family protein [bacterium]
MSGNLDKAKGRVKEAVGSLTGNADLKREGRIDQGAGAVKEKANKVVDGVKKALKG